MEKHVVTFTITVEDDTNANAGAVTDHMASLCDDVEGVTVERGRTRRYGD